MYDVNGVYARSADLIDRVWFTRGYAALSYGDNMLRCLQWSDADRVGVDFDPVRDSS